jgi:hypothetical protein
LHKAQSELDATMSKVQNQGNIAVKDIAAEARSCA